MKRLAFLCVGIVFLVGVSGCGSPTAESVMRDQISSMNALADALEKKDVNAVKAAINRMKDVARQMGNVKEPSEEEMKKLRDKYKEEGRKAEERLNKAEQAAKENEELSKVLKEGKEEFMKILDESLEKRAKEKKKDK